MKILRQADGFLLQADPVLAQVIATLGPCQLQPNPDAFAELIRSVIGQQLSVKAARTIHGRLQAACDGQVTPTTVLQLDETTLRTAGLSGQKSLYVKTVAAAWQGGTVSDTLLRQGSDEDVITALTAIKGIGVWTAHMFLIFTLGRLDVLPVGDLGFRNAVRRLYALDAAPDKDSLERISAPWRPYRSVGAWHCWQSLDNAP